MTDNPTAVVPSPPPVTPSPSQAPAPSGLPAAGPPRFDRKDPYWDASHPEHKAAVEAVAAGFKARAPSAAPWRDDQLAHPGVADPPAAPYLLEPPVPGEWASEDRRATTNTFHALAGSRAVAQAAFDYLERSPAAPAQLPEPPADYRPPDAATTVATLQRGWGAHYAENRALAEAVIDEYIEQHGGPSGALMQWLQRTGIGRDPKIWRLAAHVGRARRAAEARR